MRLVSFHPFRALGLPGVVHLKPEQLHARLDEVRSADGVLFPETWQVNALAYALRKRVFPSVPAYHLGRDKVEMTRAFQALVPQHVPHTLILPASPEGVERAADELGFPMVVKEPRNSMGRGVWKVESRRELAARAAQLDVLYAQEYLEEDRDLRVVVVGDRVVTAYWRIGGDGFHHNVACGGELSWDGVPPEVPELALSLARDLGVDHAGFDLMLSDGRPYLLELNVMFGTRGLVQQGISLAPVILEWLERTWSVGAAGDAVAAATTTPAAVVAATTQGRVAGAMGAAPVAVAELAGLPA